MNSIDDKSLRSFRWLKDSTILLFLSASVLFFSVGTGHAALKDSDADGLSDESEISTYSTDPNKFDTDGDTVGDGSEVLDGTDPADAAISVLSIEDAGLSDPGIMGEKSKFPWYLGRATGIVAFVLLTLGMCFGLIVSSRTMRSAFAPATSLETHRFISFLALAFVALHFSSFFFDDFMKITGAEAFVPFLLERSFKSAGGYDVGVSVAWGIMALYGIIILVLTSEFRSKIPIRIWRATHYISFVTYILFLVHGFASGTDSGQWWMQVIYVGSLMSVLILVAVRIKYRNAPFKPVIPIQSTVLPGNTPPISNT